MKRILVLFSLVILLAGVVLGDESVPPTPKPTKTPRSTTELNTILNIRMVSGEKQARLIIPKSQLKQLRAELDGLDDADAPNASALTRTQTIVSGLFLSLAMVFGGVWFARSGKAATKKAKIVAAGAVLFFGGAFATLVFGNVRPPTRQDITSELFKTENFRSLGIDGEIKLEVTDTGDKLRLIVPKVEESK